VGWIGFKEGCLKPEEARRILEENGLRVEKMFRLELEIEGEWIPFLVYDVVGYIEGTACYFARTTGCVSLEGGKHLILGEVSAKIWDEAVRVCSPEGVEYMVTVYTFDGFLDVRIPSKHVKGLEPQIVVGGRVYRLPLSMDDLEEIAGMGRVYVEKIEKAASVYGIERIVSREALEELRRRREEREKIFQYEVDYDSGFAVVNKGGRVSAMTLPRFLEFLIENGRLDDVEKIYREAPEEHKKEVAEAILEVRDIWKVLGRSTERIEEVIRRLGLMAGEGEARGQG